MMVQQVEIILKPKSRGFHLVTGEIFAPLAYAVSPINGDTQICKHTSSLQAKRTSSSGGLSINENADPDGRLNMGTWQGIYFCEYRNYSGARRLVVTIIGE